MGFDLLLIATNANGLKIPVGAKCCICKMLLDDGVGLSGCSHNACYKCMKDISEYEAKCPIDGNSFDMRRYFHLDEEIEGWLSHIKLKCGWFDGQICTATAISLRNAHRHRDICPNNPKNKKSREQIETIKFVKSWLDFEGNPKTANGQHSDNGSGALHKNDETSDRLYSNRQKPRPGYGFRPNKQRVGQRFFTNEKNPDLDSDWRH